MRLNVKLDITAYIIRKDGDLETVEEFQKEIPIDLKEETLEKFLSGKNENHKKMILQGMFQNNQTRFLDRKLKESSEFKDYHRIGWRTCKVLSYEEIESDEEIESEKKKKKTESGAKKKVI